LSIQAMSWVIENSRHKGSKFVVLLMIANHAHSDGTGAWPAAETLARESRLSTRQVIRIIPKLAASGELEVQWGAGPRGTNLCSLPGLKCSTDDKLSGVTTCQSDKHAAGRGQMQQRGGDIHGPQMSPDPSLTVIREPSGEPKSAPESGAPEAPAKHRPSPSTFSGAHLIVSERLDRILAEAFPLVDLAKEYPKANAWLEVNPRKRPKNSDRFIYHWMSRIEAPTRKGKGDIDADERTRNNIAAAGPSLFPN
jgi:hypothetical protein